MFGKRAAAKEEKEEVIDYSYEGKGLPRDMLSYKEMDIEMSRWAATTSSWSSILVLLASSLSCCLGSTVVSLFVSGFGK